MTGVELMGIILIAGVLAGGAAVISNDAEHQVETEIGVCLVCVDMATGSNSSSKSVVTETAVITESAPDDGLNEE